MHRSQPLKDEKLFSYRPAIFLSSSPSSCLLAPPLGAVRRVRALAGAALHTRAITNISCYLYHFRMICYYMHVALFTFGGCIPDKNSYLGTIILRLLIVLYRNRSSIIVLYGVIIRIIVE